MIHIKRLTAGLLAGLLMVMTGCKDYLEVNNNPNQVTAATPQLVLPDALATTAGTSRAMGPVGPLVTFIS